MKNLPLLLAAALVLAACAQKSDVTVTRSTGKVVTKSRSEPIFYNGKTYQLDFSYLESAAAFDMKVSGMSSKQQKDAVQLATSSLAYFACPDGQKGRLANTPEYDSGQWLMQARCA